MPEPERSGDPTPRDGVVPSVTTDDGRASPPHQTSFPFYGPIAAYQQSWSAPYPPPEAAERFEALQPGSFNRIMVMAEQAQAAEIRQRDTILHYERRDNRWGQILGASISAMCLAGAVYLGIHGQAWLGGLMLSVPTMSVARALIGPRRSDAREHGGPDGTS